MAECDKKIATIIGPENQVVASRPCMQNGSSRAASSAAMTTAAWAGTARRAATLRQSARFHRLPQVGLHHLHELADLVHAMRVLGLVWDLKPEPARVLERKRITR